MYQNDWMLSKIAEERRHDLMRQLEHDRLVREAELARHPQRHMLSHMLDWVGRQLVRWGERLQARHAMHHRQALTHTTGG
jgi:serine/threonine protein phosphatase PrpC